MSGRLEGKLALVTGASRGLGRSIALAYAREGAEVVCVARTLGALEELDDAITKLGGKSILVPMDLLEPQGVERIAAALAERFGRLDILVGNAGTLGGGLTPVSHMEAKNIDLIFDLNVKLNWRLIKAFEPLLRQSPAGRALFVTDRTAHSDTPFWGIYAASKAALESMVGAWAAELVNITQIRANLIDPGPIATRLRAKAFPGEDPSTITDPDVAAQWFIAPAQADFTETGRIIAPFIQ